MYRGKPVIGITAAFDFEKSTSNLRDDYYEAIIQCGAVPVLIPVTEVKSVWVEYLDICDGIVLSGGPDIDAVYFGQNNMPYAGEISPVRDEMEIFLAKQAMAVDKPILGICRGIQVLNIAAGGSIFQDIYAENNPENKLIQHSQPAPRWFQIHSVNIMENTCLFSIYGKEMLRVNSFHHQAVNETAPGFTINAYSEDGIIEAISNENKKFVLGVQWHPENMWRKDKKHLKLFERLVAVC
ncbi:gamma-glutamyl-gamma-aminobutyrate hydrolase family protein [Ruminiclostridium cellobioparum]|uniref:Putative glutamine amidotransferase n=1 Tax=Ruminiclostridium cellobioparum subsp. termitidis CT1112 TaxID=1195236 RepID=S0FJ52_RUMCE|nr:gamma-glutamyl-gamma-aminobutyrate hydrolase family protein [Ruminiclostridium cellobioparum]EMS72120.1 putative glutamine amidotransferase [Ruminiclostridium cellobioparum subsp. termitidis CT1112]